MKRVEFTQKTKEAVYLKFIGKCADCGVLGNGGWAKVKNIKGWTKRFYIYPFEIHHLIAVKNGGTNQIANLVLLCQDCHKKRHKNEIPEDPGQNLG